jgi:hypothetical protein
MKSSNIIAFTRLLCFFLAMHILNCSIDAPDALPNSKPEDLTVNEMESVAEVVLEKILDFPAALPEHDENDQEEGMDFKLSKFVLEVYKPLIKPEIFENAHFLKPSIPLKEEFHSCFFPDIPVPPPWKMV